MKRHMIEAARRDPRQGHRPILRVTRFRHAAGFVC